MSASTSQAQSALIFLSVMASFLERGEPYTVSPADLQWVLVALELMPQMPLADDAARSGGEAK